MRVLVTGAGGMLGTDVCCVFQAAGLDVIPAPRVGGPEALDVTNTEAVRRTIAHVQPQVVVHCAAYTNVDQAEHEPDVAFRVNALGSWNVAIACAERNISLCAISTDFVFDGQKTEPYTEFDLPHPIGIYGASKLAGEECIREVCWRHWIVRTSWLYGVHGKCFPDSILRAAETRAELRVVADQRGCPTYTVDLADALARLIHSPLYGTYHIANTGVTTWYHFANKILELAGKQHIRVTPILSSEWPSPAKRPANSALRPYALELQGAPLPRSWQEALIDYMQERTQKHNT
jgi:dTDP-4-dehydrorhamnose reductase